MFKIIETKLLSLSLYGTHKDIIPTVTNTWWLITPGYTRYHVCSVTKKGDVDEGYLYHVAHELGVRPVLRVQDEKSHFVGEKIKAFSYLWTILEVNENEVIMLCDDIIAHHKFATDSNDWNSSQIKKFLENFFKEKQKTKQKTKHKET